MVVSYPNRELRLRGDSSDFTMFVQIWDCGSYDLSEFPQFPRLMRDYEAASDPVIIDAGANVGMASLWFAERFPRARVIALEPGPGNYRELIRHTQAHANIKPVQGALASEAGHVSMIDPGLGECGLRTEKAERGIRAYTIEELVDGDPFILKIDIEGAEKDLFQSPEQIDRFSAVIIETHDWLIPGTSTNFIRTIAPLERDLLIKGENLVSIRRN